MIKIIGDAEEEIPNDLTSKLKEAIDKFAKDYNVSDIELIGMIEIIKSKVKKNVTFK